MLEKRVSGRSFNLVLLVGIVAWTTACLSPSGGIQPDPSDPEAAAGAAFLKGRMLELEGRLAESAEAYEEAAKLDPDSEELPRYLAQVWARAGEPEKALKHAERAMELSPEDGQTRNLLSALYIANKQYEQAIELLEPRLEANDLSDDGLFGLFNLYLEIERLDGAERVARQMLDRDPHSLRGYFTLANVYERRDQIDAAESVFRDALAKDLEPGPLYDAIARLRRRGGDSDGELEALHNKLKTLPRDAAALLRIAQIQAESEKRGDAIATLEELTRYHPDQIGAEFQLGYYYYEEDRYDDAINRLEAVLEKGAVSDPRFADEVRYVLGLVYEEAGQTDLAMETLDGIAPESERFGDSRSAVARLHERAKRYDAALTEIGRAISLAPENIRLQVYKAGILQRSGNVEEAVSMMEKLIDASPDDIELRYDLGVIYGESGSFDHAVEIMTQVIAEDPNHASALNYVGYTWADKGLKLEDAEQMIRRAGELRPRDGYITDSLGWVLYQQGLQLLTAGKTKASRVAFEAAIEQLELAYKLIDRQDPIVSWHLGDAYRSVSRFSDALAAYKRAFDLDPNGKDAEKIQREIELLELQLGSGAQN